MTEKNKQAVIRGAWLAVGFLCGLLYSSYHVVAQSIWSLSASSGVPTGSCSSTMADLDVGTGKVWSCPSGSWVLVHSPALRGTTATIVGTLLAVGSCDTGTATVTGATTGMHASASPVTDPGIGIIWHAMVSSANTVTVKECALVLGTPNNTAYNVVVNP